MLLVDGQEVVQRPLNHRGEPGGGRECWRLLSELKLAQDFAAVAAVHAAVQHGVDVVAEESHRTIAKQNLSTTCMEAARPEEASEVHHNIRDPAVRSVVAVGQSADGSGMRP